ncbi:nucleoside-diphosphate sugar epimerase/dehydratase [Carnobacteriaceae bacterium 52-44]
MFDSLIIFTSHVISYFFLYPLVNIQQGIFFGHILMVILFYIGLGSSIKIFDKINRFTSARETTIHVFLVTTAYLVGTLVYNLINRGISFRYVTFSFLISVIVIPTSRIIWRLLVEYTHRLEQDTDEVYGKPVRTLIIGAGEAGAIFVRSLKNRRDLEIIGFLDDNPNKQGTTLYGYPIIGKIEDLEYLVNQHHIEQVTIAIPSLSNEEMNSIVEVAKKVKVKTNQMPYIEDILSGKFKIDEFKDLDITDLLGRDEVELNTQAIESQINNKTILISGAGGSIGSEICRQIAKFSPKRIVILGHGEYSIYKIEKELLQLHDRTFDIKSVIGDLQDRPRMFEVMHKYQPDIVYHAAAHKHVPLMEKNPREAVKNNVFGTKNIAEASKSAGVTTFVMVSTDKAVNPPNVMGSTKRIAEMIVTGLNEKGKTNFVAVRFGNVLGSSGSVVPVFREQIEHGGPITVTDFRMTRYFMTIPEASRLVMQAGALADGGEIFVLDMGEPVKIIDLAKQMIWLSGHTEKDIGIVETGIRPGEKLYEELLASEENTEEKVFDKIFVGKVHNLPLKQVLSFIDSLKLLTEEELKDQLIEFANNGFSKIKNESSE